jgi:hypothetical protein
MYDLEIKIQPVDAFACEGFLSEYANVLTSSKHRGQIETTRSDNQQTKLQTKSKLNSLFIEHTYHSLEEFYQLTFK